MNKISNLIILCLVAFAGIGALVQAEGIGTLPQLQQFVSTTTPYSAYPSVTQNRYGAPIYLTGLTPGGCVQIASNGLATTTACGSGSGGTGNVATSTTETAGQLPYWTSTGATPATLGKVATTSATCAGTLSCTSFTVIGPSPITLTGSGSSLTGTTGQTAYFSGSNTAVGTSTMFITTSGQVGFGTTSPTTNAFVSIQATTTNPMPLYVASTTGASLFEVDGTRGFTSIGSTTPWAQLSLNPSGIGTGPEFVIGSSTKTDLVVTNAGNLGIGTTTPNNKLDVNGNAYFSGTGFFGGAVTATSTLTLSALGTPAGSFLAVDASGKIIATTTPSGGASLTGSTGQLAYFSGANTAVGTSTIFISAAGLVGIGTTTPPSLLTVGATPSQLVSLNPLFLLGTSTLASASANGTYIGVNAPTGFAGNFIDMQTAGVSKFTVTSSGGATFANNVNFNGQIIGAGAITGTSLQSGTSASLTVKGRLTSGVGYTLNMVPTDTQIETSGDNGLMLLQQTFAPTSGTGSFTSFKSADTINQTGNSSGITRGMYVNPTLTAAYDYRALEIAGSTYNMSMSTTTLVSTLFNAPTFASTTATTLTNGYTQQISGAPVASTNVTISTSTALFVGGGAVNGGGTVTTAIGLEVFPPTGGGTNKAIQAYGTIFFPTITKATGGTNQTTCYNSSTGELVDETTTACAVSSRKFKNSIKNLNVNSLDMIMALNPVSYSYNQDVSYDYQNTLYGFIAEDAAQVDPHLAEYGLDGKPRTLDDRGFLAVLWDGMRKLIARVSGLEAKVEKQQKQIDDLNARLSKLEKK